MQINATQENNVNVKPWPNSYHGNRGKLNKYYATRCSYRELQSFQQGELGLVNTIIPIHGHISNVKPELVDTHVRQVHRIRFRVKVIFFDLVRNITMCHKPMARATNDSMGFPIQHLSISISLYCIISESIPQGWQNVRPQYTHKTLGGAYWRLANNIKELCDGGDHVLLHLF